MKDRGTTSSRQSAKSFPDNMGLIAHYWGTNVDFCFFIVFLSKEKGPHRKTMEALGVEKNFDQSA